MDLSGRVSGKLPKKRTSFWNAPHLALLSCCALWAAGVLSGQAAAARTLAGTEILNVAQASYVDGEGASRAVTSNPVLLRVEEILDLSLIPAGEEVVRIGRGEGPVVTHFRLTNLGNGPERFELLADESAGGDDFDPKLVRVVIDSNANGVLDPEEDRNYASGRGPLLAPDESIDLFVIVKVPGNAADRERGLLLLTASAATGTGSAGTIFPAAGESGVDAVVGLTGASSEAAAMLLVSAGMPTLVKLQDAPERPRSGDIVTYTLVADFAGSLPKAPAISDQIPAGTSYVAGSMTLGGTSLSDEKDGDPGRFDGERIAVVLPETADPQEVTFRVSID